MLDLLHSHSYWNIATVIVQSHALLIPSSSNIHMQQQHLKGSNGCKSTYKKMEKIKMEKTNTLVSDLSAGWMKGSNSGRWNNTKVFFFLRNKRKTKATWWYSGQGYNEKAVGSIFNFGGKFQGYPWAFLCRF